MSRRAQYIILALIETRIRIITSKNNNNNNNNNDDEGDFVLQVCISTMMNLFDWNV